MIGRNIKSYHDRFNLNQLLDLLLQPGLFLRSECTRMIFRGLDKILNPQRTILINWNGEIEKLKSDLNLNPVKKGSQRLAASPPQLIKNARSPSVIAQPKKCYQSMFHRYSEPPIAACESLSPFGSLY